MKKMKLNKNKLFIFASMIIIGVFVIIYGVRFVHYYLEENPRKNGTTVSYFHNKVIAKLGNSTSSQGLFYDAENKEYYFKGDVSENYVWYSGRMWRILSVNDENEVKLISDKTQTLLNYKNESNYLESYINQWLNISEEEKTGIFENTLYNKDEILVNTKVCVDSVDDLSNINCSNVNNDYLIGLVSLFEYNRAGGVNSFINTSEYLWTSSETEEGSAWYIFDKGGTNSEEDKGAKYYGLKPIITLKSNISASQGNGSYSDPYVFGDDEDISLANRSIGEYIFYSGYTWRIINRTESSVKVAMEGYILKDDKELSMPFSTKKNTVDTSDKTSTLHYLNNTFYNSLENKEYVVSGKFNKVSIGISEIDYKTLKDDFIEARVGLYSFGELFISNYDNNFLINSSNVSNDIVYSINNGALFGDSYSKSKRIRPVLYLDNTILALGSYGSEKNPYVLGR